MRIIRRIIHISIILILGVGIPYLGYMLYQSVERPAKDPFQAIPDRTAIIVQVNNPLGLLSELTRNSLIWKEFLSYPGIKPVQEQLLLIDSMSRWSPNIREILKDSPLTIALSLHSRSMFDPLFLIPVPSSLTGNSFSTFVQENYPGKVTILQSPYGRTEIYRIHFENRQHPLFISIFEGVCVFSFTDALVKRAIDQLSLNTPVAVMKGFTTVASTTAKKVDANLYVNFPYLSLMLWKGVNENYNKGLVKFARYADWSGLDLYLKKDELLFNGYTIASDSAMQTLALMNDQVPLPLTMVNMLPFNTQAYLIYALIRYPDYFQRWQTRLKRALFSAEDIDLFSELNNRYDTSVNLFLEPWIGRQIGRCWIQTSPREDDLFPVTILQAADPDSALKSLISLSQVIGKEADSTHFTGIPIYRTNLSDVLNIWLSPLFEPADLTFFTIFGDFVCFSNSQEALGQIIGSNTKKEWLSESMIYLDISDNISDEANLSFYCNSKHIINALPDVLSKEYLPLFTSILDSLKKFQSFTLQLSAQDGMVYTSFQLRFNPKSVEEGPLVWQVKLDTLVSGCPQILHAGMSDTFAVLVTDTMNSLYKIDRRGEIEWKQKLYGKVLGRFHEIILDGKDSLFYLFNTENHLYVIRSDGKLGTRFPMKFPTRATSGLSIVEPKISKLASVSVSNKKKSEMNPVYSGTPEEFQLVIAFNNNHLYSFDLNGLLSEGWASPEVDEVVLTPVQVMAENSRSAHRKSSRAENRAARTLATSTKTGNVLVTDGFGVKKTEQVKGLSNSPNSPLYQNKTNSKAPWLTTDKKGNVAYFGENGPVSRISFNTFSEGHYFLYDDILGNGSPEFIFFDNNTLYYYDRFLKLVYFYTFRHDVSPPSLKKMINGTTYIGFTSNTTNEVFLFDRHGYVEIESGVKGTTPFDIGTLENENSVSLVIGSGKVVKGFLLMEL